jgi:hypothetical protein
MRETLEMRQRVMTLICEIHFLRLKIKNANICYLECHHKESNGLFVSIFFSFVSIAPYLYLDVRLRSLQKCEHNMLTSILK